MMMLNGPGKITMNDRKKNIRTKSNIGEQIILIPLIIYSISKDVVRCDISLGTRDVLNFMLL